MDSLTVPHTTTLHRLDIHLADTEFGNTFMWQVAEQEFKKHTDLAMLFITVVEHGGWWLQYARCGCVIGTANDQAVLSVRARQIGADSHHCRTVWLPAIWRQEFFTSIIRGISAAKYVVDDSLNGRTFAQYQREGPHPLKGAQRLPEKFRVVGWINRHSLQPVGVICYSYLNAVLTNDEAIVLARDYLREIKALKGCDLDKPDYIH